MSSPTLHLFIGKGGVGKTTVSLAAAAAWAAGGENVLFAEIADVTTVGSLLGEAPLEYKPRLLLPQLHALKISGKEALHEYLLRQIRVERLYRLFFENRPVRYFFDVAPALRDLMVLGKIVFELDRKVYDRIVIDAPATGHALFLLRAPRLVKELTRLGPIFNKAAHILDVFESARTTAIHIVTLARPVVVSETLELITELRRAKAPLGHLYVNRVLLPPDEIDEKELRKCAEDEHLGLLQILAQRARTERREQNRIQKLGKLETFTFPELDDATSLVSLGECFDRKCRNA